MHDWQCSVNAWRSFVKARKVQKQKASRTDPLRHTFFAPVQYQKKSPRHIFPDILQQVTESFFKFRFLPFLKAQIEHQIAISFPFPALQDESPFCVVQAADHCDKRHITRW